MTRSDGRTPNQMRAVSIKKHFIKHAEGSVLIQVGNTQVICNASVEDKVPPFLRDKKQGWVTAEYSMLPRSTHTRTPRESSRGKVSGRTQEIQRLIGRSLRTVVDMEQLGERTLWIDCDVIQADGGTRTASITGAFVAMCLALKQLKKAKLIDVFPVTDFLPSTSVGILNGKKIL
ncbi:MAG: ribonuclease PH, partial [Nitrospinae bacterium]|nr:ribonuclease PH [Nitrospinota bacterium]